MDVLPEITRLGEAGRVARIQYRRPGGETSDYVVELYGVQRAPAGLTVRARQVSPGADATAEGWREFRLDRITSVADTGQTFQPRAPVAFQSGSAPGTSFHDWGERPIAKMGPAEDYFRQIEQAMLDGRVTEQEMSLAEALRDRVEVHERKAAHARVYANVLNEVLQDGRISHREELYLRNVRAFLDRLGWAP